MSEIFNLRNTDCNLRSQTDFKEGPINTVDYGLKSLRYLTPKIWNLIPLEIRSRVALQNLQEHKILDKDCPCT